MSCCETVGFKIFLVCKQHTFSPFLKPTCFIHPSHRRFFSFLRTDSMDSWLDYFFWAFLFLFLVSLPHFFCFYFLCSRLCWLSSACNNSLSYHIICHVAHVVSFISPVLQHLYIPVTLRTAEGSLNVVPDKLVLRKCFPVGCSLFIFIFNRWVKLFRTNLHSIVPCVASHTD